MHRVLFVTGFLALGTAAVFAQQSGLRPGSQVADAASITIQGGALDAGNRSLRDLPVRLRDARLGRIVRTQLTDTSGAFAFRLADPGSYVIELLAAENNTVLAASHVINVNAGESVTVIVKLPGRRPSGGLLGHHGTQAAAIAAVAAATGVLTRAATTDVSPERAPASVR